MRESFNDLRAGESTLDSAAQVAIELIVITHRGERGDRDEAAIARTQVWSSPQIVKHHLVGQLRKLWRVPKSLVTAWARAGSDAGTGARGATVRSAVVSIFRAV